MKIRTPRCQVIVELGPGKVRQIRCVAPTTVRAVRKLRQYCDAALKEGKDKWQK